MDTLSHTQVWRCSVFTWFGFSRGLSIQYLSYGIIAKAAIDFVCKSSKGSREHFGP